MNIFPLLLYVHFLAFSHLRKGKVLCAVLHFSRSLFACKPAQRSLWLQSHQGPWSYNEFCVTQKCMLFSWSEMRWKHDVLNNLLSVTFLYHNWEIIVEITIFLDLRFFLNVIGGLEFLLSFPSLLHFSPLLSIMLCDFLKSCVFHTVPSLPVLQHRIFVFCLEVSCNQLIPISKQLIQNVFL